MVQRMKVALVLTLGVLAVSTSAIFIRLVTLFYINFVNYHSHIKAVPFTSIKLQKFIIYVYKVLKNRDVEYFCYVLQK